MTISDRFNPNSWPESLYLSDFAKKKQIGWYKLEYQEMRVFVKIIHKFFEKF